MLKVYQAFRNAGVDDVKARVLTAQVGREGDFLNKTYSAVIRMLQIENQLRHDFLARSALQVPNSIPSRTGCIG